MVAVKNSACFLLVSALLLTPLFPFVSAGGGAFFPQLAGWERQGTMATYTPDNLYEYIDGAAENFLSFEFQQLTVQNYKNAAQQSLTVEIYRHSSPLTAYGVYSSEKPRRGEYLAIGGQGYYEEGILNFVLGPYYVKLTGFDLGATGRQLLSNCAGAIQQLIALPAILPEELNLLPQKHRMAHSERFIQQNFLGHSFLQRAFLADYQDDALQYKMFIIKSTQPSQADQLLRLLLALDTNSDKLDLRQNDFVVNDPYNGLIRIHRSEGYILGGLRISLENWSAAISDFAALLKNN